MQEMIKDRMNAEQDPEASDDFLYLLSDLLEDWSIR